jgi:hypothetical protein
VPGRLVGDPSSTPEAHSTEIRTQALEPRRGGRIPAWRGNGRYRAARRHGRRPRLGHRERGRSEGRAEEIAARTVNKERARAGESRQRSRSSTQDISSGRRGGKRSGRPGPRGRTRDQLYNEARQLGIEGRSKMSKDQLQKAIAGKKS